LVPVDLKDNEALDRLAAALLERWGRLDILVGNAGILGELAPLTHLDPPVWDAVMAVNVTANWRLIRAMDPLLRASAAGRAVFITSSVARSAKAYWGAYAVSKAALETMARIYAAETQSSAVKVMLANPGPLRTAMRRAAMPGEDPLTLKTPQDFAPALIALTAPEWIESGRLYDFSTDKVVEF
jgi:NAD(P)-dependent dehydrogenase (short-subunit alcohol dehydrogenase family)